jgi:hypothetical protein
MMRLPISISEFPAMSSLKEFRLAIEINSSRDAVWRAMVDWEGQSAWMLSTRVYDDRDSPEGVGHRLKAFTGPFPRFNQVLGVMDHMYVSAWDPPRFCRVEHVGRIIRGYGTFTLHEVSANRVRFDWFEEIDAPGVILAIVKPAILLGVWVSLRRFRTMVERTR